MVAGVQPLLPLLLCLLLLTPQHMGCWAAQQEG
jgi:hypothetical protein